MIQLKIAFLDEEKAYLEQLQGYLIRKKESFFKVWTFQSLGELLKCPASREFDAVVMTAAFVWQAQKEKIPGKLILLSQGKIPKTAAELPAVAKYQPMERLFNQISAYLWKEKGTGEEVLPEHTAELIGVYSPVHCENQILFSMAMAQILSEKEKVLYVNLMEHSGFYGITKEQVSEDVGDLIYGMMETEYDFTAGLHRIRQNYMEFDYIPPTSNPEHLSEISKELYEKLILELKNRSGYDAVVIDFGSVFLGFAEMLPILGRLYCLGKEDAISRYQMDEFLEYLGRESSDAKTHLKNLILPGGLMYRTDGNPLENSLYGTMGDYIRKCLFGGEDAE